MAMLLRGADTARVLTERMKGEAAALSARGIVPTLAILRVGEREDDLSYERGAMKRCEQVGIAVRRFLLPSSVTQEKLLETVDSINADPEIDGCLIFRPLPGHLDDGQVRARLLPAKDVDGITDGSMSAVYSGSGQGFSPCTAQACVEILKNSGISLSGKRVTVVGRSLVIGRPAAMLLLAEHATVTICHTRTQNLPAVCREAEILIAAAGKAGVIGRESAAPGQIVLDVGIHMGEDGRLCGDVRFDEVEPVVKAITPVPGGVGAVTTSVLAGHVIEAALASRGRTFAGRP
ncbi:bifunctional 5,10-methylenetetrahydrofolate dehydrogenase/5,10-methenyltetrahydrofolate cyclohydrolase [Yanshouia hominis]|uniref:Bifunctional protein FolD n=1 Tax=Yanshouia hominis TaxID=2763673 RepID=A0ABR7NEH6_9FIRM|nr:bifunctional 5,10-methylenetetrahydrofolate dehydrogenase/5,10-methenyltetrahydrofolate cyclohydrolase [Yanshouia hominis]MBC8574803.1 bifunctional 5,10-methylenetetrahydrofolate dehydrogenase/5,10-methenyltetrahydrofolate cyclohydrolase [Yanshouia hominis]